MPASSKEYKFNDYDYLIPTGSKKGRLDGVNFPDKCGGHEKKPYKPFTEFKGY